MSFILSHPVPRENMFLLCKLWREMLMMKSGIATKRKNNTVFFFAFENQQCVCNMVHTSTIVVLKF